MKKITHKSTAVLLALLMIMSSLVYYSPVSAQAANHNISITLDVSWHRDSWTVYGMIKPSGNDYSKADIEVSAIGPDNTVQKKVIDVIGSNEPDTYTVNFSTSFYPNEIRFNYAYLEEASNFIGGLADIDVTVSIDSFSTSFTMNEGNISTSGSDTFDYNFGDFDFGIGNITEHIPMHYVYYKMKMLPGGYNFDEDRYKFDNINEPISKEYYIGMFEEEKGTELYNYCEDGSNHGHCFGMALSTAATLINAPKVTDYISWAAFPYTKLSSVNEGTINSDLDLSAKDYIKYCHIYQYSAAATVEQNNNKNNLSGLRSGVYDYVYNNGTPVLVGFTGSPGGHEVFAIGIDGSDILVNDSNEPNRITRIRINGNEWSYSGGGYTWSSTKGNSIDYTQDILTPYLNICCAVDVQGANVPKDESQEISGTGDRYAIGIKPVSEDELLVVDNSDSYEIEQDILKIESSMSSDSSEKQNGSIYWLAEGTTLNAKNTSENTALLKLVGDELKISAELPKGARTIMEVDENGNNGIEVTVEENEDVTVTFTTVDTNGNLLDTAVSGTASSDEITATQTETGLVVTGISDGTVTLSKDEEVIATQEITDADSDIEITYDANGENEELDVDYHTHSYSAKVTKAATCKQTGIKTYTCSCSDSYTQEIALNPSNHAGETEIRNAKDSTCTEKGYTGDIYCLDCGEKISSGKNKDILGHKDSDSNNSCDVCGETIKDCSHMCHKSGFMGFIWKIIRFLCKLFGCQPVCSCGVAHY